MYLQPILRCKNPECLRSKATAPIRVPCPDPPKADQQAPTWPPDGWQRILVCRDCDHWYAYEKKDIEWVNVISPADLGVWCVELQCNEPRCESRTKWHLLDDGIMSAEDEDFLGLRIHASLDIF